MLGSFCFTYTDETLLSAPSRESFFLFYIGLKNATFGVYKDAILDYCTQTIFICVLSMLRSHVPLLDPL